MHSKSCSLQLDRHRFRSSSSCDWYFNDHRFAFDFAAELGHQGGGFGKAVHRLQLNDENLAEHLVLQRFDKSVVAFCIKAILYLFGLLPIHKRAKLDDIFIGLRSDPQRCVPGRGASRRRPGLLLPQAPAFLLESPAGPGRAESSPGHPVSGRRRLWAEDSCDGSASFVCCRWMFLVRDDFDSAGSACRMRHGNGSFVWAMR